MDKERYAKELDKMFFHMRKKLIPELSRNIDKSLNLTHIYLLGYICGKNCIVRNIAEHLGITLSAVTQLVEKLVCMNLVVRERSEEDRRVVHVRITEDGKRLLENFKENRIKVLERYISVLTQEEIETHFKILEKLSNHILSEEEKVQIDNEL